MFAIKRLLTATVTVAGLSVSAGAHACDVRQIGDYNQATMICNEVDYRKLAAELRRQQEEEQASRYSAPPNYVQPMPRQVGVIYGASGYLPPGPVYMGVARMFGARGGFGPRFW